jgi:peptide/nickel transport system permease protein
MLQYAVRRILVALPLLVALSIILFLYIHAVPGDPIAAMLGPNGSPALIKQLRHAHGLDQPLPAQYWNWVVGLFHGSLGVSLVSNQPIAPILVARLPATIQLTLGALFFTVLLGLPAGFFAGVYKGSWLDRILSPLALIGLSMPVFWVGTLLFLILGVQLRWLPTAGYVPFSQSPIESLRLTFMPAFTLGFTLAPFLARLTRAATVELRQEQFIVQTTAKGLRRGTVLGRYLARNTVLPVLSVLGLQLGTLIGGQVIVEQVFNWPGIGRLLIEGAMQRDYLMVQSLVLIVASSYIVVNLGVELLHAWLDPRVRL